MILLRNTLALAFLCVALPLAGCSGGSSGGGGGGPIPGASAPVILVAGSTRSFSGTDTATHVYPNPTGTQANYTSSANFTATTTIQNSQPGAPAAFDVNQSVAYTITQPATTGSQTTSTDTDTFENQTMSGGTTTITNVGSRETVVANDVSATAAGGGPYTATTNETTSYVSPFTANVYPLQSGYSIDEPLARTVTESVSDTNAGGAAPPSTYNYVTSQTETYANDGSYTIAPRNYANGTIRSIAETSNGTGTLSDSTDSFAETIGLPAISGGTYAIPVTVTNTSGSTTTPYSAADWYPGGALPVSPLETESVAVKGPVSSLPAACAGALAEPNVFEVDTTIATLNVFGSTTNELQQAYNSNGINDCLLRTTTTQDYSLTTGALTETTTDTFAQVLTAVGTTAVARRTARART